MYKRVKKALRCLKIQYHWQAMENEDEDLKLLLRQAAEATLEEENLT